MYVLSKTINEALLFVVVHLPSDLALLFLCDVMSFIFYLPWGYQCTLSFAELGYLLAPDTHIHTNVIVKVNLNSILPYLF